MIVLSQAILTDTTLSRSLNYPRILYQNHLDGLAASAITVSGETTNGPRDAILTPDTAEYWQPPTLPAWILVDLGIARSIDAVGLAGHDFGSRQTSITVEVGGDPTFASSALFGYQLIPGDDGAILMMDSIRTGRYLRISLAGSVAPKLAVVYAGQALAMERMLASPYKPIDLARRTTLKRAVSRGGQYLGQTIRRNGVASSASFRNLSASFIRQSFDAFAKAARSKPYFFAWNPLSFPTESGYVWTIDDIVPQYSGNVDNMDVAWEMVGIGAN